MVFFQHLSSYLCKAQHNWKERIFLGASKNADNKITFSVCIRYWNKYVGLPSKQEPWVNCSNLPCKAELFSLCPLPQTASFKGHSLSLTPNYSFCFSSLFVRLSIYPGSQGMRDAFHFLETSGCAVLSVVSWGMVVLGFWTAAQGRPKLMTHQPWNSFHYTIGTSPEAGQLSI